MKEIIIDENGDIVYKKDRTRAIRRKNNVTKAIRKMNISKSLIERDINDEGWYDNLHQYSKNKIHCSCPMCRFNGPTHSDMMREEGQRERLKDYLYSTNERDFDRNI